MKIRTIAECRNSFIKSSLIIFFGIMGFACVEREIAEPEFVGKEYFAHQPGSWIIYDVDSLVYDDFLGQVFQYQYQVKEVNKEILNEDTTTLTMLLERYWRKDAQAPWQIKNNWTSKLDKSRGLKTEENVTYVKMVFPVKLNKSWNGNAYNNKATQIYRITDIHQERNIAAMSFDSTMRVLQKDFTTLIGEELQFEIYALGVGMIEKHYTELHKDIDGTILRGVKYSYIISEFGNK
jgi:hypothetical protein